MAYLFYCTKTPSENFYSPRVFFSLSALCGISLERCALGAVAGGCLIGAAAANADLVLGAVILRLSVVNAVFHGASDAGVYVVGHVIHGFILPELISLIVCALLRILFRILLLCVIGMVLSYICIVLTPLNIIKCLPIKINCFNI